MIDSIINQEDNEKLCAIPKEAEIKEAIFGMERNSGPGPHRFGGAFYQGCWSIIKKDLIELIQSFFNRGSLTIFYNNSCLVLLPKVEHPESFSDLRPISLSNFSTKIISKILSTRLDPILPKLISENESGFVRGRLITENILLAQEIFHGINKESIGGNVVIKLDIAKAYDRVSWDFILAVLRKFGSSKIWIDIIRRSISNNWYSLMINGHIKSFFHSTRGLMQRDPLSPALFIIGAEVLSRLLNQLISNDLFKGFTMHKNGPQITT